MKKSSKEMVWRPATQTPAEDGVYLTSVLYQDQNGEETTIKTAFFVEGAWCSFNGGLRDGERMIYWLPIPQVPGCPPFTQLAD